MNEDEKTSCSPAADVDNGSMNTPTDPSVHARIAGRPGENARAMALFRALWPLLVFLFALGWMARASWPHPALSPPVLVALFLLLVGGAAACLVLSRMALASFIKGAAGEEKVAQTLAFLPAGWEVFHGLPDAPRSYWPSRDLDHVVLGPSCVFVIETKNWSGRIQIRDNAVLYEGGAPSRPPLEQVRRCSNSLAARLEAVCGSRVTVHPVLCFAGSAPEAGEEQGAGGVIVCGLNALNRILVQWKDDPLTEADRQKIQTWLRQQMG